MFTTGTTKKYTSPDGDRSASGEVDPYAEWTHNSAPSGAFVVPSVKGNRVAFVGKILYPEGLIAELTGTRTGRPGRRDRSDRKKRGVKLCHTCVERTHSYAGIVTPEGLWMCQHEVGMPETELKIAPKLKKASKGVDWTLALVSEAIPHPPTEGVEKDGTPLPHQYIEFAEVTSPEEDHELLKCALHKYTPLVTQLVKQLIAKDGIVESLDLFKSIVKDADYAEKLLPGTIWLEKVLETIRENASGKKNFSHLTAGQQMKIVGEIILSSRIAQCYDGAVITDYHQSKQVLDLLRDAQSESGLRSVLQIRMDPQNYQRRTTAPTTGQIGEAKKKLGNFKNTIMTIPELEELGSVVRVNEVSEQEEHVGVFDQMLATKKDGSQSSSYRKTHDFASRVGSSGLTPTTMEKLYQLIQDGTITKLEVDTSGLRTVYVAKTTLDQGSLCVPHLWSFTDEKTRFGGRQEITHLQHIKTHQHDNWMFILKGASESLKRLQFGKKSNCCFPEFLSTSIKRHCGSAFEEVNRITPIEVPEGPIAMGVGTSVTSTDYSGKGKLLGPVSFYLNGSLRAVTISMG